MSKLGQSASREPAEQRCAFASAQTLCVTCHALAHFGPVGDCYADIAEHGFELGAQAHPAAGIGAGGFEIDDRFAMFASAFGAGANRYQAAIGVAAHVNHWMQEPVDCQALRRNRCG